jgi:endonuclease YncB( thermonuclease family)
LLAGKVVGVSDGDTIVVLDAAHNEHRIRLAGIDAPEKRQAYGDSARRHLAALVHGRPVVVEWRKRDRYGRLVGRVLPAQCAYQACSADMDAGFAQIKSGLAWHYKDYAREQAPDLRRLYASAEEAARAARVGIWQQDEPTPPWQFRRRRHS